MPAPCNPFRRSLAGAPRNISDALTLMQPAIRRQGAVARSSCPEVARRGRCKDRWTRCQPRLRSRSRPRWPVRRAGAPTGRSAPYRAVREYRGRTGGAALHPGCDVLPDGDLLAAPERAGDDGWRSTALSMRAHMRACRSPTMSPATTTPRRRCGSSSPRPRWTKAWRTRSRASTPMSASDWATRRRGSTSWSSRTYWRPTR